MHVSIGQGFTVKVSEITHLDISVYPKKWTTCVNMGLWEKGNHVGICFEEKTYLNYDKFMPKDWAIKLFTYRLNRQSQKVANMNVF